MGKFFKIAVPIICVAVQIISLAVLVMVRSQPRPLQVVQTVMETNEPQALAEEQRIQAELLYEYNLRQNKTLVITLSIIGITAVIMIVRIFFGIRERRQRRSQNGNE